MKILVFTPMHPNTPKLFGRTNQSIFRLDYEPIEMLFSKGDNPHESGVPLNDGRLNILHNYNKARDYVLKGDWEAMLTVEYDMVVPSNAVHRLLDCDADIAYGLYVFRARTRWSAYLELGAGHGKSISEDEELAKEMWGKQMEVAGVGMGCTLIKRNVLEAMQFRGFQGAACDWYLAQDAQENGFKQVCDLGLVCGHISMNPSPRVIWPDPEMPGLYRNDFIDGIPTNPDGSVDIEIGQLGEFYIPKDALVKRIEN